VSLQRKGVLMGSNSFRHEKLRTSAKRMTTDGLNSLKYDIVKTEEYRLYTQITVNVDPDAV
jgi:hypothetical protein